MKSEKINKLKSNLARSRIPDDILNNQELNIDIAKNLPDNYTFEIHKTIWFIKQKSVSRVFLQFPEGLIVFACRISDLLEKYCDCEVIISSDVVYGACCVDDYCARLFGADVLIHYGHSCLYPIQETNHSSILYVFVEIRIEIDHFLDCVASTFNKNLKLSFVCTIQFITSLHNAVNELKVRGFDAKIAQTLPLSRGEILGCTSPKLPSDLDALIYLGDGRFHIESAMIQNPELPTYRYDPYSRVMSLETYDFPKLISSRGRSIETSRVENGTYGLIMGTLGRQGSLKVLKYLSDSFRKAGKKDVVNILVSEISPDFISRFNDSIDVFVQVACPRLSIDWGSSFSKPLLTPYEAAVMLGQTDWNKNSYPMDYYSKISTGPWTPNHTSTGAN